MGRTSRRSTSSREGNSLNQRLAELTRRLAEGDVDAALLLHPRDVLYYAGTVRPSSLLVVADPRPDAVLFARRALAQVREEATVERVVCMRGFSTITAAVAERGLDGGVLGLALDTTPAQLYQRVTEAFDGWDVADLSSLVLDQRTVKDRDEIAATRLAAEAADAGHQALPGAVRAGMEELELVAEVERAMRLAGHEGYQPLRHPLARGGGMLLMSGENLTVRGGHGLVVTGRGLSPASPYGASRRRLAPGDLIVLDIGATRDGYTADESRSFVVGAPSVAQQALFAVAMETEAAVLEAIAPGVPAAALYETAEAVIRSGAPPFFAPGSLVLPGFVGHGIGLELDEPPVLWPREEGRLREGTVLAVEIEVSAPDAGTMAKLEDTVVVRHGGCEVLTGAPRDLIVCG